MKIYISGKIEKQGPKKRVSQIKTTVHILNQWHNCFDFKDVYVHLLTLHPRRIQYSLSNELKSQHNDTEYSYEKQDKNKRGMNIYFYFLLLSNASDSVKKNDFKLKIQYQMQNDVRKIILLNYFHRCKMQSKRNRLMNFEFPVLFR